MEVPIALELAVKFLQLELVVREKIHDDFVILAFFNFLHGILEIQG